MGSRTERRNRLLSLCALPVLLVAGYGVFAWRNIEDYVQRNELSIRENSEQKDYAGALWRLEKVRLIGDGRDTKVTLPGERRLLIVRLAAKAEGEIGDAWFDCRMSLTDGSGREWAPLDFISSDTISRTLDPQAKPVEGCAAASRQPPARDAEVEIEEKFVIPASAAQSLQAKLSFASTRPEALALPLGLQQN